MNRKKKIGTKNENVPQDSDDFRATKKRRIDDNKRKPQEKSKNKTKNKMIDEFN